MLIFLYGPDTFRSRQKLNEIIDQQKRTLKSGLNLRVLEGSSSDFQDFKNEIETISMFREKKLVILKNAFSNEKLKEALLGYKKELLEDDKNIIVFYEEEETDRRVSLFKFLKDNSKSQEFELLEDRELKSWVKKEVEKYNFGITPEALETLILYCGNDLWSISNEINKLAVNRLKSKSLRIEVEDVRNLVKGGIEAGIFETIEAISAKKKKTAIALLHSCLEKGEPPLRLLSMINYQFRNILLIKTLLEKGVQYHLIPRKTGIHPFAVKKTFELCRIFTSAELKKIYQKIFQVDLSIKTGRVDSETALDLFIAEI